MNAVVKFPSKEAALVCYHDPHYQEVRKIRMRTTSNGAIVLADAYQAPSLEDRITGLATKSWISTQSIVGAV